MTWVGLVRCWRFGVLKGGGKSTIGTCWPQPHQVDLSVVGFVRRDVGIEMGTGSGLGWVLSNAFR